MPDCAEATSDGGWAGKFGFFFNRYQMGNFKDLRVWQEGLELAADIYSITKEEPFSRDFGLCNQIQRAAVSIPSNIAEGDERGTNKECIYYFNVAKGSCAEVITQLNITNRTGYISTEILIKLEDQAERIRASLKNLIRTRVIRQP
ncbi:MAG: four helix bundle protein [Verrucomicrobiae bacterium]|nr:four helix bundle protein [Verrucomicrobiae bacterium]